MEDHGDSLLNKKSYYWIIKVYSIIKLLHISNKKLNWEKTEEDKLRPTPNKHWLPKDTHNTVKLFIEEAKAKENEHEKIKIKKCWHAKSIDFKHS